MKIVTWRAESQATLISCSWGKTYQIRHQTPKFEAIGLTALGVARFFPIDLISNKLVGHWGCVIFSSVYCMGCPATAKALEVRRIALTSS